MSENLPRYLNTVQAAAWIGLSPKTLQRMRVTGEGPPYVKWGTQGDLRPYRSRRLDGPAQAPLHRGVG